MTADRLVVAHMVGFYGQAIKHLAVNTVILLNHVLQAAIHIWTFKDLLRHAGHMGQSVIQINTSTFRQQ